METIVKPDARLNIVNNAFIVGNVSTESDTLTGTGIEYPVHR